MLKRRYFKNNIEYFNYTKKHKDDIKIIKVYWTKPIFIKNFFRKLLKRQSKICLIYKNKKK